MCVCVLNLLGSSVFVLITLKLEQAAAKVRRSHLSPSCCQIQSPFNPGPCVARSPPHHAHHQPHHTTDHSCGHCVHI